MPANALAMGGREIGNHRCAVVMAKTVSAMLPAVAVAAQIVLLHHGGPGVTETLLGRGGLGCQHGGEGGQQQRGCSGRGTESGFHGFTWLGN